jgi:hypothetical protein
MKIISYIEAEQKVAEFIENDINVCCFLFYEDNCIVCNDFMNIAIPTIEEYGINVFAINLRTNFVPFPPMNTPSTFWYIKKDVPPMMKKGIPPKHILEEQLEKMIKVNKGELTIQEAFF